MLKQWLRFEYEGKVGFGILAEGMINVHQGNMFDNPTPTGERIPQSKTQSLIPVVPSKMVALLDNYHALINKLGRKVPLNPLYFFKGNNSFLPDGGHIRCPAGYTGKVVYEGELGIVIGKRCRAVSEADTPQYIFGYTCINDVTAQDILNTPDDFKHFPQWTRAKSFDTFGVLGPVVTQGLDPSKLSVKTILNGDERQNYPVSDMIFAPHRLVSLLSQDITLEPGDVIACGTSVGVGSMKPGSKVSIVIEGIGSLNNLYE